MNLFALSGLLTGITSLSVGLFVFIKQRRSLLNKIWIIFTFTVAIWGFGCYKMASTADESTAFLWYRLAHIGVTLIPIFIYHFIFVFLDLKKKIILKAIYFIGGIFFIANLLDIFNSYFFPDKAYYLIIAHMKWIFDSFYMDTPPGPIYPYFVMFFAGAVGYVYCELLKAFRKSTGVKRAQIKYFFLATLIGFIGGGTSFLPVFGINVYPVGNFATAIWPFIITYAIVNYRLLDINIVITRAGIFTIVYLIVLGLPFGIGYKLLGKGLWYIPLFVGIILASGGPFIYGIIRRRAENRLRREEFLAHQALNKLAQDMMRLINLEDLLKLVVEKTAEIMKVNSTSIYLKDEASKHYHLRANYSSDDTSPQQSEFIEDSALIKDILLRREPIVSEELKFKQASMVPSHIKRAQSELYQYKTSVIVPIFKGDLLLGLLMIGTRRNNRLFTQKDLSLLLFLSNQLVLAIENTQLIEKEKSFLAEKSRRDALADMAPGVAHQFDNRLQSILFTAEAQMLLNQQQDLKKLSPDKLISIINQSQKTLDSISEDAKKGKEISDAVKSKGRAKLIYERQELLPIIQSAINRLKISRAPETLQGAPEPEITIEAEENLPKLFLKQSQTDDVFYNLVDNARDAIILRHLYLKDESLPKDKTPCQGKITIKAYKKNDKVIVTVADNGIGMKEKELRRLFVPWFTTKATSIKGTGMGLHAIQAVIEDHKGRIKVESEYGKGTTFTIEFPINPELK